MEIGVRPRILREWPTTDDVMEPGIELVASVAHATETAHTHTSLTCHLLRDRVLQAAEERQIHQMTPITRQEIVTVEYARPTELSSGAEIALFVSGVSDA